MTQTLRKFAFGTILMFAALGSACTMQEKSVSVVTTETTIPIGALTRCQPDPFEPEHNGQTKPYAIAIAHGSFVALASSRCPTSVVLTDLRQPTKHPSIVVPITNMDCPWLAKAGAGASNDRWNVSLICRLAGPVHPGHTLPPVPVEDMMKNTDPTVVITISVPLDDSASPNVQRKLVRSPYLDQSEPIFDPSMNAFVIPCSMRMLESHSYEVEAPAPSDRLCFPYADYPNENIDHSEDTRGFASKYVALLGKTGAAYTWDEGLLIRPDGNGPNVSLSLSIIETLFTVGKTSKELYNDSGDDGPSGDYVKTIVPFSDGSFVVAIQPEVNDTHDTIGMLVRFQNSGKLDTAWGSHGVVKVGVKRRSPATGPLIALLPDANSGSRRLLVAATTADGPEADKQAVQDNLWFPTRDVVQWYVVDDQGQVRHLDANLPPMAMQFPVAASNGHYCGVSISPTAPPAAELKCVSAAK